MLARTKVKSLSTSLELLLGALAGALAQVFTIPVAVIATRQQLHEHDGDLPGAHHAKTPSMLETAKEIVEENGLSGLWTGLKPSLILCANPAITYGVFERLKAAVLASMEGGVAGNTSIGPGWSFLLGTTSKTLATIVTYPYIFAKVRLQAKAPKGPKPAPTTTTTQEKSSSDSPSFAAALQKEPAHEHKDHFVSAGDLEANKAEGADADKAVSSVSKHHKRHHHHHHHHRKYHSAIELLQHTYELHGFAGWYQGMGAQILKAVLSQGESLSRTACHVLLIATHTDCTLVPPNVLGILFMLKDQFERYALVLMLLAKRALGHA